MQGDVAGRISPSSDWRFDLTILGWLPDIPVDIETNHGDPTLPESLGTLIDDLQFVVEFKFEAHKGSWGFFVLPIMIFLEDTEKVQGPFQEHKVKIDEDPLLVDFGVSYEVGRWQLTDGPNAPVATLEPFVGGRLLNDDIEIKFDPGENQKTNIDFIAPIVGLNATWGITDAWSLHVNGDYGGFDVADLKETWSYYGAVRYRFHWGRLPITIALGYRKLRIDYQDTDEIELKATAKGPIISLGFSF